MGGVSSEDRPHEAQGVATVSSGVGGLSSEDTPHEHTPDDTVGTPCAATRRCFSTHVLQLVETHA